MSVTWQLCTFYSCFGLKPVWTLFFTSTFHFAAVWLLFSTMTDIDHSKYKRKVINPSHIYSAKRDKCEKLFDLNHHVLTLSQFLFNLNFLGETFSLAKRANARLSCPTNESRVRAPSIGRIYHCLWIIQSNENIYEYWFAFVSGYTISESHNWNRHIKKTWRISSMALGKHYLYVINGWFKWLW